MGSHASRNKQLSVLFLFLTDQPMAYMFMPSYSGGMGMAGPDMGHVYRGIWIGGHTALKSATLLQSGIHNVVNAAGGRELHSQSQSPCQCLFVLFCSVLCHFHFPGVLMAASNHIPPPHLGRGKQLDRGGGVRCPGSDFSTFRYQCGCFADYSADCPLPPPHLAA